PTPSSRTFGNLSPSQRGTPGQSNDGTCVGYTMSRIPAKFRDIATTGQQVQLTDTDEGLGVIDVSSSPVTVFGASSNTLTASTNGWLVAAAYSGTSAFANKTAPGSAAPDVGGTMAVFWDDLWFLSTRTGSAMLAQRFAANQDPTEPRAHWIVQWNKVAVFATTVDDLTFQVKLFDSGDIEYHYAAMTSGSSASRGDGNSATVWLEQNVAAPPRALVFSVNQPAIRPNSAIRFTRVP
ncbi:MAG: hypothetical protein INH37_03430, partial [Myxococcaceae bacterium]|nr:hypothetical protein [Myxococcaceae bacterium]